MTQGQAAGRAGISQATWSRIERGHLAGTTVETLRAAFAVVESRLDITPRWRGGDIDRLRDGRHARLVGANVGLLARCRWQPIVEVTFSEYGERGSIDVLGLRRADGAALVCEDKATFNSAEETARVLDAKTRLAAKIVYDREGWRPLHVSRLLILEATMTNRRRVAAHEAVLTRAFPLRGDAARAWLRHPVGSASTLLFVSSSHERTTGERRPR